MKLIDTSNDTLVNTSVDQLSGKYDEETERYGLFFDLFAHNSVGHGLYFSKQEERKMLEEVGIKPGFFTVKVGDKEGTYFLSKYDEICPTIPKKQYDEGYKSLTQSETGFFRYKVGAQIKIDGEYYTLGENKNVDIPYGTDFYHIIKADKSQYEDFYIQNPQY